MNANSDIHVYIRALARHWRSDIIRLGTIGKGAAGFRCGRKKPLGGATLGSVVAWGDPQVRADAKATNS